MGSYKNGANGNVSGKFGSVIGSHWKKTHYVKGLPKKYSKGPSEDQIAQRVKFAMCSKYLKPIKDILNIGYGHKTQNKMSPYNWASRLLLSEWVTGEYPNFVLEFSLMKISSGSMVALQNVNVVQSANALDITWIATFNPLNCFKDDEVYLIVYNENQDCYFPFMDGIREDLNYNIDISGFSDNDKFHLWAFCCKRDQTEASKTQYLGEFVKA